MKKSQISFVELSSHKGDYVDIDNMCKLLGMSKRTLQMWRDDGIIPYSKIVGKIYFKVSDVIELLETKKYGKSKN
jgi:DNA-binding transcriptional MerR regulator